MEKPPQAVALSVSAAATSEEREAGCGGRRKEERETGGGGRRDWLDVWRSDNNGNISSDGDLG